MLAFLVGLIDCCWSMAQKVFGYHGAVPLIDDTGPSERCMIGDGVVGVIIGEVLTMGKLCPCPP